MEKNQEVKVWYMVVSKSGYAIGESGIIKKFGDIAGARSYAKARINAAIKEEVWIMKAVEVIRPIIEYEQIAVADEEAEKYNLELT